MPGDCAQLPRQPLAYRITGRQWLAIDVATAVLAALALTFNVRFFRVPHLVMPGAPMLAASLAASLPVAVRRAWPLPALAVVVAGVSLLTAYGLAPLGIDLMLGMASYMAAVRLARPVAMAALVGTEAAIGAGLLTAAATAHSQSVMLHSMLAAAALWFVGDGVRERRKYQAGVAEQEERRRRDKADRARRAVREERLRIARELHDVLAHTLSVVAVQAGVGRRVGATRPAQALAALSAVEEASRGALDELRRILCLMRGEDEHSPLPGVAGTALEGAALEGRAMDGAALAPAPGLADLDGLAALVRSTGTAVTLSVRGPAAEVPPAAALTVYRIIQEALTNVVRHAPGATAEVLVSIGTDGVRLRVADAGGAGRAGQHVQSSGPGAAVRTAAGQHGIVGMRERAAAFGGTLSAGAARAAASR